MTTAVINNYNTSIIACWCMVMKVTIILTILLLKSCYVAQSHQPESCSSCNCLQVQLNSIEKLQKLVESIVNNTLNKTFQHIQQQINASIEEKVASLQLNSVEHRDINSPGKYFNRSCSLNNHGLR